MSSNTSFERLIKVANNISQEELARVLDESAQTITNWKRRGVSKAGAIKASAIFGVSTNWILSGVDNPDFINAAKIVEWDSSTNVDDDEVEVPFYKDFLVSCGTGSLPQITGTEMRKLRLSKTTLRSYGVSAENAYALTAHGDSMKSVINNGATVFVDMGRNAITDGKIFAISHGGLFKFKYLYKMPKGGVRIVSENKDEYPEEVLTAEEMIDQEFCVIAYAFNVQNPLP